MQPRKNEEVSSSLKWRSIFQSEEGVALDSISANRTGFVIVGGEYWKAKSSMGDEKINKGDKIKVVEKEADLLIVEHLHDGKQ